MDSTDEAFNPSARVLSEVKAILKTWAPGVVEACSSEQFGLAMQGLKHEEKATFERVCQIAAVVSMLAQEVTRRGFCGRDGTL